MSQTQVLFESVQLLIYIVLMNIIQPMLELWFTGCFSGKKVKIGHYIFYIFLSFVFSVMELKLSNAPVSLLFLAIRTAMLWCFGALLLKYTYAMSLITAVIAKTVNLLSAGCVASVTFLAVSADGTGNKMLVGGFWVGVLGLLITFGLTIAAYQIILKRLKIQGTLSGRYLAVFFLPVMMVLIVEQYIYNQVYGNEVIIEGTKIIKPIADHWQMLFIQLFGGFSLFSILYACRRLAEDCSNRTRLLLMEREMTAQRDYLEESRTRDDQTRSFRHDLKHHLLVLGGMLEQGETIRAKEYLGKLKSVSESFSYPCNTGNTVVDMVLGSKLNVACQSDIQIECTVRIPSPCTVDDLDLCVLFSNAVDNAIHACNEMEGKVRFIRISGMQKGNFFMIEVENSCLPHGTYKKGVGLTNMEAVSEKYHGAVTTEKRGDCFLLNILLVISRYLDDISVETH